MISLVAVIYEFFYSLVKYTFRDLADANAQLMHWEMTVGKLSSGSTTIFSVNRP